VVLADGNMLQEADFIPLLHASSANGVTSSTPAPAAPTFVIPSEGISLDEVERMLIQSALRRTKGNVTAAARLLQMSREKLRYRIRKFGLHVLELSNDLKEGPHDV
jgi:two-component system response regulator AtoC